MKKFLFLSLFLPILISGTCMAQDLKCEDFKSGSFILPKSELVPFPFKITRKGNQQIEWAYDVPDSLSHAGLTNKEYGIIKWNEDCSYKLWYDSTRHELDEIKTQINRNGGLLVKIKRIEKNCAFYEATGTIEGQSITVPGKLCKVDD